MPVFKSAADLLKSTLRTSSATVPGVKIDADQKKIVSANDFKVKIGDKTEKYYPWGVNNKRPKELIELLSSNADMENLLKTRADFLFGAGLGLFENKVDGFDLVLVPVQSTLLTDWLLEKDIETLADNYYTNQVNLSNSWINVDIGKDNDLTLKGFDASTVRVGYTDDSKVSKYLVSGSWDSQGAKQAKDYPAFDFSLLKNGKFDKMDYFIHVRPEQPGQFWYGYAPWSSLKPVIELANMIPGFHTQGLETEGNLGHILHIAKKYFRDLANNPNYTKEDGSTFSEEEVEEAWADETDYFLFGDGKRKVLTDMCEVNPATNELVKFLEIETVKKTQTGKEYLETGTYAVNAMSNGSGVLNGLSGVSDGKMNSSGGTEIRISAEYQQFYRTPRERQKFLRILNLVYVPYLRKKKLIPDNVYFNHKNILLQTLDTNKSGSTTVAGPTK